MPTKPEETRRNRKIPREKFDDNTGVTISLMSKKDRPCDTTGVTRSLMSKKDIQYDTTGVARGLMSK
jgi:hypothetical protein